MAIGFILSAKDYSEIPDTIEDTLYNEVIDCKSQQKVEQAWEHLKSLRENNNSNCLKEITNIFADAMMYRETEELETETGFEEIAASKSVELFSQSPPSTYNTQTIWNVTETVVCRLSSVLNPPLDSKGSPEQNIKAFIKNYNGIMLGGGQLDTILAFIKTTAHTPFDYIANALCETNKRLPRELCQERLNEYNKLESLYQKESILFLPYFFPHHIVLFTIDFSNASVEYFDPAGKGKHRQYHNGYFSIFEELNAIAELCFPDRCYSTSSFMHSIQKDTHNCGFFLSWYVERRLEMRGIDAVEIIKQGKISDYKQSLAERIGNEG